MLHDPDLTDGQRPAPGENLRSRAEQTDRAARFEDRLASVQRDAVRRRGRRRVLRMLRLASAVGVGGLVPLVVAAVTGGPDPRGLVLVAAGLVAGVVLLLVDRLLQLLARRRGSEAWDWHHERYVLLGNPSREVRDADSPGGPARGPFGP